MKTALKIERAVLDLFIEKSLKKLHGDWVMIGGTVLPYLGFEHRATMDIDFVGSKESSTEESLKLMEIAESLGLPVETINQAGAYFYYKAQPKKSDLVLLKESKQCRIYRPNAALFVILKLARLSESDLQDCLIMIKNFRSEISVLQNSQILVQIEQKMAQPHEGDQIRERLETLRKNLS